jgi:hypothetical protein
VSAAGKCMWGGCGHDATAQICVKVWSLATPRLLRNEKNCLRMVTSVTICEECKANVKVEHFLLPEGKERIAQGLSRAGAAAPDFAHAALDFEEIIDRPLDPEEIIRRSGGKVIEA